MCAGVLPQQPPTMRTPASRSAGRPAAISSGVSLYTTFMFSSTGRPAFGCAMIGKLAHGAVAASGVGGEVHVDPRAAVEGDDVRALLDHEHRRLLGTRPHHGADLVLFLHLVECHRANDDGRPCGAGGANSDAELFERRLGLDDDGVDAACDQRFRLLGEGFLDARARDLAVGLEESAERTDVAEDEAGALAEGVARDSRGGAIDLVHALRLVVALEHDARAAEAVGDEEVGAGLDVRALDGEDLLGSVEVPGLAAAAWREPRLLQLGAHGAVAEEHSLFQRVEELHATLLKSQPRRSQRPQETLVASPGT